MGVAIDKIEHFLEKKEMSSINAWGKLCKKRFYIKEKIWKKY